MIIPTLDSGLEALVRHELALSESVGDVSFDAPSGTWSAQLNRITVNLFLFGIGRSPQPPRPAIERPGPDGRIERRPQLPMLQVHYLVSAWAGTVQDEHQLIGDLLTCFILNQVLPAQHLPAQVAAGIQLAVAPHDNNRAKDVWSTVGGHIKPSFELIVTTAIDALPFADLPTSVARIQAMVAPVPDLAS
ncbi:DUF4255 domain-containing protein [Nakamurella antarctica]|uniref:DUF4255 domain-containing protein n=1 Tax=Nakamurella antarctica TaxID=1902245 RepID=A0A3G8ZVH9_9ACTN|nr:DUF4255 domain-containing protein [Nakamurella antarctica]AZI58016.1 DUF4255 domain-containing protein [Nakamurella antarctica]